MDNGSNYQNDLSDNISSMALMYTMVTPTFGNESFMINQINPGEVQDGFPSVPYLSLEALIYIQQSTSAITSPTSIVGGSNTGQQVIQGSQTTNDSTGTPRVLNGTQNTS
jgi:hypothetical protein